MDSLIVRYPGLVEKALVAAKEKITKQTIIRDEAAKKVQNLRVIDKTSPYTSIGSEAGQAEIAYNIEDASLRNEFEELGLIYKWAPLYLEYIQNNTDTYNFDNFNTFVEVYTSVNRNHLERLIHGYSFDCKCHFFGHGNSNQPIQHQYINGEETCLLGVPVHLCNISTAINKIGFIGCQDPEYIYPIPTNFVV
jgi:hypothetical protein